MAEISIDQLMTDVGDFQTTSKASEEAIRANAAGAASKTFELSQVYDQAAQDAGLVATTKGIADLQAQQVVTKIAQTAGADPALGANRINELVGKLVTSQQETEQNLKEYRAKAEVKPWEHPIDYIVGQLTLPFTEERLKGSMTQTALYDKQLGDLNQTLSSSAVTINNLKESVTSASIAAQARLAEVESKARSTQAEIDGIKFNSQSVEAAVNASRDRLSVLFNAKSAANAETQLKVALGHLALDTERFQWQKEEKAISDKARADGKEIDGYVVDTINKSRVSLGLPPLTGLAAKSQLALFKSGASEELKYHFQNGERIDATGVSTVGNDPASSLHALETLPSNLPDVRKETTSVLAAAKQALELNKTIDKKDKKAVDAFINQHVAQDIQTQYRSIAPNSGNLFDVGDIGSYLTLNGVSDLGVTQKFLGPLAAAKQPLNDPKIILSLGVDAVKKGQITSAEFQQLASVYQKASVINQAAKGFTGFGIVPPNAGRNYYAKTSRFGGTTDMTDPTELGRYLMKDLAGQVNHGNPADIRGGTPNAIRRTLQNSTSE